MPFETDFVLAEVQGATARLVAPLVYQGRDQRFTVPSGFETDFASVPQFMTWLVPKMGAWTLGAILHDWLCTDLEHGRTLGRRYQPLASARETDGIFRRILRELGVGLVRRWLFWTGVRWGALRNPARRAGWLRDAPAVVGISLLALPFVLLPGLLTGLVVLIDDLVERVR